jgi:CRISPR type III-A-associated protein Csm2
MSGMKSFVDLFCGAGGAGLGLKRAGLVPLLGVDKYVRAVKVYMEVVGPAIQADVRELDPLQVVTERPFLFLGLFGEVRRIEMEWRQQQRKPEEQLDPRIWRRLQLLKPLMAHQAARLRTPSPSRDYQESRAGGDAMVPLIEALGHAIDRVERNSDFQRFLDFFDAILAYLRFYRGR